MPSRSACVLPGGMGGGEEVAEAGLEWLYRINQEPGSILAVEHVFAGLVLSAIVRRAK
jgi:predicted Rossmann-fold nucleotide-binding protein